MKHSQQRKCGRQSLLLTGLSMAFLACGLLLLGWGLWPSPTKSAQFAIPAGVLAGTPPGESYASLADYHLSLSWPRWVRVGDTGTITVMLVEQSRPESLPADSQPAQLVLVEPVIAGLRMTPPGSVQANLAEKQRLSLNWSAEGNQAGQYPGKLFVGFGFYDPARSSLVSVPVVVVDLSIRVITLWGLESGLAVWLGLVSLAMWGGFVLLGRFARAK